MHLCDETPGNCLNPAFRNPFTMSDGLAGPANTALNPDHAENSEDIEKQFAVKAVQQMTTYWNILEKMRGSTLRLTKMDDEIYVHFKKEFPDWDPKATINEDEMKSKAGKEKWRNFISEYEKKVEDYNFGTMLRNSPRAEYDEKDTIFGAWQEVVLQRT